MPTPGRPERSGLCDDEVGGIKTSGSPPYSGNKGIITIMYLHLGQSVMVHHSDIIGIFDLDNASWAYKTREFLDRAEEEGRVISACDDLPRSFVVTGYGEKTTVYLSQLSSAALTGRVERNSFE